MINGYCDVVNAITERTFLCCFASRQKRYPPRLIVSVNDAWPLLFI